MNPKHILDFVAFYKKVYTQLHDENKRAYDKYKVKYDAKWYHKMFGMQYTGLWDFWDWPRFSVYLDDLETIRREAEYKNKMEYMRMDIPEKWQERFYKWADDNKIPY